jgi:L-alanine-DL-glutamate epimerase-like enolase superfamily enzyme
MKITGLRTKVVNVPFAATPGAGSGELRSAGAVLVFLHADQGLVGEGVAFALNGQRIGLMHDFIRSLEPLVVGSDPRLAGDFRLRAWKDVRRLGAAGLACSAIAPLDMALLDLRAKAAGLNVAALLGACRTAMPAYISAGLWVDVPLDALQRQAGAHVARGFRAMKMRLIGDPRIDIPRVRALREAIGPGIGLMADANQRMTVPQALRLGRELEEFNLDWLEEPIDAFDHAGEAQLAASLDTPIACGESVFTSRGVRAMLELRAVDVLMPDLQHMGGPGGFLQAAALAAAYDIPVSGHLFPEMSLGLLAAVPNASILEYMPWLSPLYREAIALDGHGRAVVPLDRPGWGFAFDEGAIERFSA